MYVAQTKRQTIDENYIYISDARARTAVAGTKEGTITISLSLLFIKWENDVLLRYEI